MLPISCAPTILLVDDDPSLLEAIAAVLRLNGFEVLACKDARSAEAAFCQAHRIDLLLTDLQMPDVSGTALAERLCAVQPHLPVMIISGALLNRVESRSVGERGWCSLSKPLDSMQMLTVVYSMLERRAPAAGELSVQKLACFPDTFSREPGQRGKNLPETMSDGVLERGSRPSAMPLPDKGGVLLIGNDSVLLRSRQLLLESVGFKTFGMSSYAPLDSLDLASFNVVLLCRSVGPGEAVQIARTLHDRRPDLPILRFASCGEPSSEEFATALNSVSSPRFLIAEVERLASQTR